MTRGVSQSGREDSLLAHCIARAIVAEHGGLAEAVESFGPHAEKLGKWTAVRAGAKVTPKASRVASVIVQWAIAMREERRDQFSITEFQRHWFENERRAYRLQSEFRELWPEYENPNELARQIVEHLGPKTSARDAMSLPTRLRVTA